MSAARPETGATDADIEAAAKRYWVKMSNMPWNDLHLMHRQVVVKKITDAAEMIVPPGFVIALAEHVLSAADREAIGRGHRLLAAQAAVESRDADYCREYPFECGKAVQELEAAREAFTVADLARLERLGSGGEETT